MGIFFFAALMITGCEKIDSVSMNQLSGERDEYDEVAFVACDSIFIEMAHNSYEKVIFSEPSSYLDSFLNGRQFIVISEETNIVEQSIRETYYDELSLKKLQSILNQQYIYTVGDICGEVLESQTFVVFRPKDNRFFICNVQYDDFKWILSMKHLCPK